MDAHEDVRVAIHRGRHVPPTVTARYTVERERLYDRLDVLLPDAGPTRIVSIAAPAGSGKTVLLSRWCQRLTAAGGWSVAWLTVDDSDNDVEVLFAAIVAALAAATGDPVLASEAETLLVSPGFRRSGTDTSALISDLLHHSSRVCFVLDDAHLLHDATALEQLARLFRWAPMSCRLVLAGRFEPPLLLTRCRVEGNVTEIAPRQMNMTACEARELLSRRSFDVDDDVLTALMIKTEGWAAGLQLAAITALRSDDPLGTLTRVGGTDRAVADYLMDEFIASLPETTKSILVATAIPDTVSASLAVHLTGRRQAHVVLEALAHDNFLLTRTVSDGETAYSYHPMMRAYLRAESERLGDRTAHGVHRRLALWFLRQRLPFGALVNAIDSEDVATIDSVIESTCVELILGDDRFAETLALLDRAPLEVRARTTTRLVVAALHLVDGHRAPAAATLAAIDQTGATVSAVDHALSAILRTQLTLRSGVANTDTMTIALRQLEGLPVDQESAGRYEFNATVALQETVIELTRGRLEHANNYLMQARDHTWAARSPMLELQCAAAASVLAAFTGEFGSVIEAAGTAHEIADTHAIANSEGVYLAQALAAHARSLRREPQSPAHGDALRWASLVDSVVPPLAEVARVVLGLTQTTGTGHEIADRIRPRFTPDRDPLAPHMRAVFSPEIQHRFLASGNTSDAVAYAGHVRHKLGDCAESVLVAAMLQRYGKRHARARVALAPVLHGDVAPVHSLTLLWAWLEEVASTADDTAASYSALCAALELAAPEGLLLPFVYVHDEVRATLDRNRGRFGNLNTFAEVVRGAVKPSNPLSTVRLSPREMDLLRELPTFRTTDAIAADQFVSVNTVKTHLRGIYRKLGVSSRRDAIAAAQQLGLL